MNMQIIKKCLLCGHEMPFTQKVNGSVFKDYRGVCEKCNCGQEIQLPYPKDMCSEHGLGSGFPIAVLVDSSASVPRKVVCTHCCPEKIYEKVARLLAEQVEVERNSTTDTKDRVARVAGVGFASGKSEAQSQKDAIAAALSVYYHQFTIHAGQLDAAAISE